LARIRPGRASRAVGSTGRSKIDPDNGAVPVSLLAQAGQICADAQAGRPSRRCPKRL